MRKLFSVILFIVASLVVETTIVKRTHAAALTLSAAALVGIATHEGFRDKAYTPVKGDVNTIGFGTTRNADGSSVKPNQTITVERALISLLNDANKFEQAVKRCAPVPMFQYEYSAYVSLAYNIGENAFCKSTLVEKLNNLDYTGACEEILKWDKFKGKPLLGLTKRRQQEYNMCIGK